jgi:hypothetical protein
MSLKQSKENRVAERMQILLGLGSVTRGERGSD